MRDGYLRGAISSKPTQRHTDVLAACVAAGGSLPDAAALARLRPSTVKRHPADLRARSGLPTDSAPPPVRGRSAQQAIDRSPDLVVGGAEATCLGHERRRQLRQPSL